MPSDNGRPVPTIDTTGGICTPRCGVTNAGAIVSAIIESPPLDQLQRFRPTLLSSNIPSQLLMRQSVSMLNMHTSPTRTTLRQSMNILPLTRVQDRLITTSLIQNHAQTRWQVTAPITEQRI